jgi:uncharacterized protein YbjT (DUF2867 family)
MILIAGASGTTGRAVLSSALARGLPLRAMYRSRAEAEKAPPAANPVVADFADPESLRSALAGVTAAFVVCAPIPELVQLETNMIEACKAAGVRHIVLNSALGAKDYEKSFPSWHAEVEDHLRASGLGWTILRPNGFMQNIVTFNAGSIRSDGAFYAAMGDAKISLVDVRDVADAAVEALSDPAVHTGQIYALNGPEALSQSDIALRLSRLLQRDISFIDVPETAQRDAMLASGMPAWQVDAILDLQAYYRSGRCSDTSAPPSLSVSRHRRTLDAFLTENVDAFRPT